MSSSIDFFALATPSLSSNEIELSPSEILQMAQTRHSKTVIQYQQRKRELPLIRDLQACRFITKMMKESEEEKKQVNRKRVHEEESAPESKRMKLEELEEEKEEANQSMDDLFNSLVPLLPSDESINLHTGDFEFCFTPVDQMQPLNDDDEFYKDLQFLFE